MGQPRRMYQGHDTYFVTARAFQSRMLLRPSTKLNEVVGGILARALKRTKVKLHGYVILSNHVHFLCSSSDGSLSRFMQYFASNVSRKAGALVGWRGQFWERRFSAEPVLDDAALDERLAYILAHGVKEGLVEKVGQWPGLSCFQQLMDARPRKYRFFAWARRWKGGALLPGAQQRWSDQWATEEQLELAPLPHWATLDKRTRRKRLLDMVAHIEAEGKKAHPTPLGVKRVIAQEPLAPPAKTARRPRPLCHTTLPSLRLGYRAHYAAFTAAFIAASARWRSGVFDVEFPTLAFRPWVPAPS